MGHVMASKNDSVWINIAFELLLQTLMHHRFGIQPHFHLRPRQIQPCQQSVAIIFGGIECEPINIFYAGPGAVETKTQCAYWKLIGVFDSVEAFLFDGRYYLAVSDNRGSSIVSKDARNLVWIFM